MASAVQSGSRSKMEATDLVSSVTVWVSVSFMTCVAYLLRGLEPSWESSCVCVQNSRDLCCVETSNIWRLYSICTTPEGSSSSSAGLHTPCTHISQTGVVPISAALRRLTWSRSRTENTTRPRSSPEKSFMPLALQVRDVTEPLWKPATSKRRSCNGNKQPSRSRGEPVGALRRRTRLPVCSDQEAETPAGRR